MEDGQNESILYLGSVYPPFIAYTGKKTVGTGKTASWDEILIHHTIHVVQAPHVRSSPCCKEARGRWGQLSLLP